LDSLMPNRPCWVEISTRFLEENFRLLGGLTGEDADLLAIVKADAYGHSLALCAPAAVRAGAKWLGVTSVEEGVSARALCPEVQILVIAGVFRGQGAALIANRLTAVVWEPWQLDEIDRAARAAGAEAASVPVHLEIDTGMSRQGANADVLEALLGRFGSGSPLRLEGVMTHLYAADEADGVLNREQLERLHVALERIHAAGLRPEILNVGNSAAVLSGFAPLIGKIAQMYSMRALMRPGLALYGLAPQFEPEEPASVAQARAQLRPVLAWKSRVVSVRDVPAGTTVGYNGTFVATETMRLALVAAGYGDGLDRRLGNRFSLLVRGERAPLVGRISMDQSVLDVTEIPGVEVGDEVVIIGAQSGSQVSSQGGESITAFDHAGATGTIPWEVFTRIAARVDRVET
jgi:alanine racemase